MKKVCFTPESGHSDGYRKTPASDPKRTFLSVRKGVILKQRFRQALLGET